jgi:hypothetical protein
MMTVTMTMTTTTTTTSTMTTTDDREGALEAVAESLGRTLVSSSQFHSEATGEGFTTGHEVELETPDGTREAHIVYVESRPTTKDRPGVLRLLDETTGESMAVWLYPGDPRLPALPAAVFPGAATVLLERLGLDATDLAIDVVAYRPGKRAVVRMTTVAGVLYLKVVRPEAAEKIRARHELWLGVGVPVPGVLASASDGIVALDALPGVEAINLPRSPTESRSSTRSIGSSVALPPCRARRMRVRRSSAGSTGTCGASPIWLRRAVPRSRRRRRASVGSSRGAAFPRA